MPWIVAGASQQVKTKKRIWNSFLRQMKVVLYSTLLEAETEDEKEEIDALTMRFLEGRQIIPDAFWIDWKNRKVWIWETQDCHRAPIARLDVLANVLDASGWEMKGVEFYPENFGTVETPNVFLASCGMVPVEYETYKKQLQ